MSDYNLVMEQLQEMTVRRDALLEVCEAFEQFQLDELEHKTGCGSDDEETGYICDCGLIAAIKKLYDEIARARGPIPMENPHCGHCHTCGEPLQKDGILELCVRCCHRPRYRSHGWGYLAEDWATTCPSVKQRATMQAEGNEP